MAWRAGERAQRWNSLAYLFSCIRRSVNLVCTNIHCCWEEALNIGIVL